MSSARKFTFGARYDRYLDKPKPKSIDEIEPPKQFHGPIRADFDDYEHEVTREIRHVCGVQGPTAD